MVPGVAREGPVMTKAQKVWLCVIRADRDTNRDPEDKP